jgi:predicted dehydrogenase
VSTDINRRAFLKAAGAAVTAVTATSSFTKRATAATPDKVRVGSIGVGSQGSFHLKGGLAGAQNVEVVALCDVYRPHLDAAHEVTPNSEKVKKYREYAEMLDKEPLDAVVIATPLDTHFQITMDALDAGKYVFCEKTLCYTIDECRKVVEKCHETGLWVQVGHQRRYNPLYNKAMWLLYDTPAFGRLHHIHAQWHRNDDWRSRVADPNYVMDDIEKKYIKDLNRHLNWRLYREHSGGVMTELATHQTDIMEWVLKTPPSRVYASGGTDYWRDDRDISDNVALIYEFDMQKRTPGFKRIQRRRPTQDPRLVSDDYTVRAIYTSTSANARLGASETLMCDKGTIVLNELDARVYFEPAIHQEEAAKREAAGQQPKSAAEQAKSVAAQDSYIDPAAYSEGVPLEVYDMMPHQAKEPKERFMALKNYVATIQFTAFGNHIMNGGVPKANHMAALHTAISGLKGLEAIRQGGGMLEIDPALYEFPFETPPIYEYENWEGPVPGQEAEKKETLDPAATSD